MLDSSDDAVAIAHLQEGGKSAPVAYANAAFARLAGCGADELTGQCLGTLLAHRLGADICLQDILHKAPCDEKRRRDATLKAPDGAMLHATATFVVKADASDGSRHVCVTLRTSLDAGAQPACQTDADVQDLIQQRDTAVRAHQRLTSALEAYPNPFVLYDKDLKLVSWNSAYEAFMLKGATRLVAGMPLREVLEIAIAHGLAPISKGRNDEWIDGILSQDYLANSTEDVELENDIHQRLFRYRSDVGDYVVIRLDATQLVRQQRAAEAAQARLIAALNAYPAPFVIFDHEDRIAVWNEAYRDMMSSEAEPIQVGMHRDQVAYVAQRAGKLHRVVSEDVQKPVQDLELPCGAHHRLLRSRVANGDLVIVRIDTTELVGQRRAVERYASELELANQEISYQAFHDDLTGLGNRRELKRKFEELKALQNKDGGEIAALHIDLDRFKQINDTMGHAAGDQVLLDVSKRILKRLTPDDAVARIGGDEFVVLAYFKQGTNRPEGLAQQLLLDLARPTPFEGKECRYGASIGIAKTPLSGVEELLTNSDVALYNAKDAGRGRVAIFDQNDLEEIRLHKALADEVLRGIEQREFVPFFQPQVEAVTHRVVGFEVLARWDHPTKGILLPAEFLSVAADLNVTADIDKMVFERAIQDCAQAFSGMSDVPSLSFNVSASRIVDHDIADIQGYVDAYPGSVTFELLETIFLEEEETEFFWKLDQFREVGIEIEVDDFGSGRASIVALQRIGPDRIKIDRRLVTSIDETDAALQLLKSIVEIGHALEMGVIAEGVETPRQAELLADLGCQRLQGHYFATALPLSEALAYLQWGAEIGSARVRVG